MAVTALPAWIAPSLQRQEGRDPLGLQTTTQDRLMPLLLPDILELSRRARYISFYAFLLHEFKEQRLPATRERLSRFIKTREYEFGLASLRCPRDCGAAPVGANRLRPAVREAPEAYERSESVESTNGGFGLYYRTPMVAFDLVAPAGTALGEDYVTPIDVLSDRPQAGALAEHFGDAVAGTAYMERYFTTTDPIPAEVIDEYAEVACLCRLDTFPAEREALADAILTAPSPEDEPEVVQRRSSIAHFLTVIDHNPEAVEEETEFRQTLWDPPAAIGDRQRDVADQWAALVAKDLAQDALCSMWTDFNRRALAAGGLDGLSGGDLSSVYEQLCGSAPALPPDASFRAVAPGVDAPGELEPLRRWVVDMDSATAGAVALARLVDLVGQRDSAAWQKAGHMGSSWQPGVLEIAADVQRLLDGDPTVAEMIERLLRRYVIAAHERIAYSKLPEFTFRFRLEPTGLRCYDLDSGRFRLAAIRHEPLTSLTQDLGFWEETGQGPALTGRGRELVGEVFG